MADAENRHFMPILDEICELLNKPWMVSLVNIGRKCNEPADWLAKKGASSPTVLFCALKNPPLDLEILLLRDCLVVV